MSCHPENAPWMFSSSIYTFFVHVKALLKVIDTPNTRSSPENETVLPAPEIEHWLLDRVPGDPGVRNDPDSTSPRPLNSVNSFE